MMHFYCRSKVFRAMFFHQMREAKSKEVVIEDAEASTVRDMLEFAYTDKVKDVCLEVRVLRGLSSRQMHNAPVSFLQRAVKLLPLAERYDISSLSGFCCEALSTHLNVEHAAEVAVVADQHQLQELKEKAVSPINGSSFPLANSRTSVRCYGKDYP